MPKLDLLCATIWKICGESRPPPPPPPPPHPPILWINLLLVVRGLRFALFNNMLLLRFGLLILSFIQWDLSFVEWKMTPIYYWRRWGHTRRPWRCIPFPHQEMFTQKVVNPEMLRSRNICFSSCDAVITSHISVLTNYCCKESLSYSFLYKRIWKDMNFLLNL